MIRIIARAVRANDLAAAGVARRQEKLQEARRAVEEKHARAEERKRAIDAERLRKLRERLQRISAACMSLRERRRVSDHEATASLEQCRPPPVVVPSEAAVDYMYGDGLSPRIILSRKHADEPSADELSPPPRPMSGYAPDSESSESSDRSPWRWWKRGRRRRQRTATASRW